MVLDVIGKCHIGQTRNFQILWMNDLMQNHTFCCNVLSYQV